MSKSLEHALAGYDETFQHMLTEALMGAIVDCSRIDDVVAFRTAETARALTHVLAVFLAMSPTSVRSPTAIRKTAESFRKILAANVRYAERSPDFYKFKQRTFRNDNKTRGANA